MLIKYLCSWMVSLFTLIYSMKLHFSNNTHRCLLNIAVNNSKCGINRNKVELLFNVLKKKKTKTKQNQKKPKKQQEYWWFLWSGDETKDTALSIANDSHDLKIFGVGLLFTNYLQWISTKQAALIKIRK